MLRQPISTERILIKAMSSNQKVARHCFLQETLQPLFCYI